ncbi:MAG: hypothetical protein IJ230_02960 [Clostridia bacterium]|nr:hypothetical protein [Clostridia bacterium]
MSQRQETVEQELIRPADPKRATTRLYLRHADALFSAFDSFKDKDRFYFIELALDMTYYLGGAPLRLADPPYYLGTILRNSLRNPELFSGTCPQCGRTLYSHSFNGSPLSGRVDLSCKCPDCGWNSYLIVSGWRARREALKAAQGEDRLRLLKAKALHPGFKAAGIEELLDFIGVPEAERNLPPEKPKRYKMYKGTTLVFNPDGSVVKETVR